MVDDGMNPFAPDILTSPVRDVTTMSLHSSVYLITNPTIKMISTGRITNIKVCR